MSGRHRPARLEAGMITQDATLSRTECITGKGKSNSKKLTFRMAHLVPVSTFESSQNQEDHQAQPPSFTLPQTSVLHATALQHPPGSPYGEKD